MFRTDERGNVDVKIGLSVDPDAYRAWADDLAKRLEAAAGTGENVSVPARMTDTSTDPKMAGLREQMQKFARQNPGMMANMDATGLAMAEQALDSGPSLALAAPPSWASQGFTVGVILPGQERVWEASNGTELPLRAKSYTFTGEAAGQVRAAFDKAQGRKSRKAQGSPFGMQRTPETDSEAPLSLFVFFMAGSSELAKVRVEPKIANTNPWNGGEGVPTPLSVSLASLAGKGRGSSSNTCVTPFIVQDAAHCYPVCELWVTLGLFDEEDLQSVTDVRIEYAGK